MKVEEWNCESVSAEEILHFFNKIAPSYMLLAINVGQGKYDKLVRNTCSLALYFVYC